MISKNQALFAFLVALAGLSTLSTDWSPRNLHKGFAQRTSGAKVWKSPILFYYNTLFYNKNFSQYSSLVQTTGEEHPLRQ
jgi:hypothetical protein